MWKNDSAESLSNITSQDAQPYAIQASGQHVYVVGYLNNGNHDVATVWVDGQPTALLGDTVNSYAKAITIAGNDVYIAGYKAQAGSPRQNTRTPIQMFPFCTISRLIVVHSIISYQKTFTHARYICGTYHHRNDQKFYDHSR